MSKEHINQALPWTGLIPRQIDLFVFPLSSLHKHQPPYSFPTPSWQSIYIQAGSVTTHKAPLGTESGFWKLSYWLKCSFIRLLRWRRSVITKERSVALSHLTSFGCETLQTRRCEWVNSPSPTRDLPCQTSRTYECKESAWGFRTLQLLQGLANTFVLASGE